MASTKIKLSPTQTEELLQILKIRFEKNSHRHSSLDWANIQGKLIISSEKIWSLNAMEASGGEPDVVGIDKNTGEYVFCDCSAESPIGRRSVCYDAQALEARKEHKPKHSALAMADEMGINLLTEKQYRDLQRLGNFDTKTSSWIFTPKSIREHGGAIFADWRYGQVFIYHNGAESYYSSRGFRGLLRV